MEQLPAGRGPQTVYDYDTYWRQLLDRVYKDKEALQGSELMFYRLCTIAGDAYSSGIAEYFEHNWQEFDRDAEYLAQNGFDDIASALRNARKLLFGNVALTQEIVDASLDEYWETSGEEGEGPLYEALDEMREDLMPRLEELMDYKNELGLREKFYKHIDW